GVDCTGELAAKAWTLEWLESTSLDANHRLLSESCKTHTCFGVQEHLNETAELSVFGRPKKEKLESHDLPLREATAPT
ncbi:hypothetical protein Taro_002383, partial [Colocasia esculenta]|nr:hypothetical protein [Colocasia esculenta]